MSLASTEFVRLWCLQRGGLHKRQSPVFIITSFKVNSEADRRWEKRWALGCKARKREVRPGEVPSEPRQMPSEYVQVLSRLKPGLQAAPQFWVWPQVRQGACPHVDSDPSRSSSFASCPPLSSRSLPFHGSSSTSNSLPAPINKLLCLALTTFWQRWISVWYHHSLCIAANSGNVFFPGFVLPKPVLAELAILHSSRCHPSALCMACSVCICINNLLSRQSYIHQLHLKSHCHRWSFCPLRKCDTIS